MKNLRVFFFALLLLASPLLQVARSQSDSDAEVAGTMEEVSDIGIVGEDAQDFGDNNFSQAPGVDIVCVFPKNSARLVNAGEETELLVGIKNDGELPITVVGIRASVHLPFDHKLLVQNLSAQGFNNATIPASSQATFPYIFGVSKYLQPGSFDLVGTIVFEIDQQPYQSTFYNAKYRTFLRNQSGFQRWRLELGARDASMDEWLQGTALSRSQSQKSKKKK
ncbi:hypothetical protein OIU77_029070 [Salix suchowensis]|uniref:Translocon-associated protein subunit alpha n=2 Tax=Salix TaxID=40685 RepID=A0ABQ9BJM4_9ROSI|nr:hypothetical protein OIU77_029070 [Salix suchowensis]